MSEYISKTEMLIILKCLAPKADDWNNCDEYNVAASQYDYMCDHLKSIEPADVAPVVHGHWIEELGNVISCRCSRCDHSYNLYEDDINGYPYCAWCGAKMDERGDAE